MRITIFLIAIGLAGLIEAQGHSKFALILVVAAFMELWWELLLRDWCAAVKRRWRSEWPRYKENIDAASRRKNKLLAILETGFLIVFVPLFILSVLFGNDEKQNTDQSDR